MGMRLVDGMGCLQQQEIDRGKRRQARSYTALDRTARPYQYQYLPTTTIARSIATLDCYSSTTSTHSHREDGGTGTQRAESSRTHGHLLGLGEGAKV